MLSPLCFDPAFSNAWFVVLIACCSLDLIYAVFRYMEQGASYVMKDDNVVIWTCGGIQVALFTSAILYVIAYRSTPATREQVLDSMQSKQPLLGK